VRHFSGLPESVYELVRATDELNARLAAETPAAAPVRPVEPPELVAPTTEPVIELPPATAPAHPDPAPLLPVFDARELVAKIRGAA